jgi:hypothetical protein
MIRCRCPLKREAHGFVEPPGIAERDPEIAELTQLSSGRSEIRDGSVFSEKRMDIRYRNDSAEQQAHYAWKPGPARYRGNA